MGGDKGAVDGDGSEHAARTRADAPRPEPRRRPRRGRAGRPRLVAALTVGALTLAAAFAANTWRSVARNGDTDALLRSTGTTVADTAAPTTVPTSPPATTALPTAVPAAAPPTDPPMARTLGAGAVGDDVASLQRRLNELRFLVGEPDGRFGTRTEHAVWAFKKLVLGTAPAELAADAAASDVTADLWRALRDAAPLTARREPRGRHVEVYLPEQVLAVFEDGAAVAVAHVSSGDGARWCEQITYDTDASGVDLSTPVTGRECGVGTTPGGVFEVERISPDVRRTPAGPAERPIFFNHSVAIHGSGRVPLAPSTRGGIAVSTFAIGVIAVLVEPGDPVFVWGSDGREPEAHTPDQSLPVFNTLDPQCMIGLYTLEVGDTPALVAAKFDITEIELDGANVATDGYLAFTPGAEIVIPPADCPPVPSSAMVEVVE